MVRARLMCLAARASDDPISPRPTITRRSNMGSLRGGPRRSGMGPALIGGPALQEIAQGGDDEPVGFLVADGEAQAVRQAVRIDTAQDQAARRQERVRVLRGPSRFRWEVDQEEVA